MQEVIGGAREDRTPDLVNAIHALSQLSYGPIEARNLRERLFSCQQEFVSAGASVNTSASTNLKTAQLFI